MRTLIFILSFLAFKSLAYADNVDSISSPIEITFPQIDRMHSLGVRIRFADCDGTPCKTVALPKDMTPAKMQDIDTIDFVGQRLLHIPQWLYSLKKLKSLSLKNSILPYEELMEMRVFNKLEILDLENVVMSNTNFNTLEGTTYSKSAKVMRDFLSIFNQLSNINLEGVRLTNAEADSNQISLNLGYDAIPKNTAQTLVRLNVKNLECADFSFTEFNSLEVLIGNEGCSFHHEYQDAFSLPKLKVLEGFKSGDTAKYVRSRLPQKTSDTN